MTHEIIRNAVFVFYVALRPIGRCFAATLIYYVMGPNIKLIRGDGDREKQQVVRVRSSVHVLI